MRILITNDDSIYSEGLWILAEAAKPYGEVVVVAPKNEQSAKSHAINVRSGFPIEVFEGRFGVLSYTVDSSPADAVRAAYYALNLDFDLVLSGVNSGFNVGEDILYSGTVAAATEAVLLGKKAIAFSVAPQDFATARTHVPTVLADIFQNKLLNEGDLFNVNIPKNPQAMKITKQGKTYFDTRFEEEQGLYYQRGVHRYHLEEDCESDTWAIAHHLTSLSPLTIKRIDFQVLQKILEKTTTKA
ncbi:MAG TPA: 5'/3'-nucleotidase SurE [Bacilli bacterium]|nr:MAG: 5'-nucleotidase SurE [Tenericutes bacterium ADurb.BinA124]HNZ49876.1 5'/3'-nucleotidase SurE [Bacilli bacterium]HOH18255.1 5'/3'-nucleotidase SurE [Bacilli bacterium]HPN60523.1 5'/3'-nucleotidase SurE [Bacilli bacterium]HPX84252.1 5'/3'-nucleotidase SurE [Bacilli bacterium]